MARRERVGLLSSFLLDDGDDDAPRPTGEVARPAAVRRRECVVPESALHAAQRRAVREFAGKPVLFSMEMGVGKTRTALAMICAQIMRTPDMGSVLYVGRLSCYDALRDEVRAFSQMGITLSLAKFGDGQAVDPDILFINYESLGSLLADKPLRDRRWPILVLDEVQAIHNRSSKTFHRVMRLRSIQRIGMTGTAVQNSASDVETIRICLHVPAGQPLRRWCITASHATVAKERGENPIVVHWYEARQGWSSPEERHFHLDVLSALSHLVATRAGDDAPLVNALHALNNARMACMMAALIDPSLTAPWATTHSTKLNMLVSWLRSIPSTQRVVLMTFYRSAVPFVVERLRMEGFGEPLEIHGNVTPRERTRIVNRWNGGEGRIIVVTLNTGGVAIKLAGERVAFLEPSFNPQRIKQGAGRLTRLGNSGDVKATMFFIQGSIEECVLALANSKENMARTVLSDSDVAFDAPSLRRLVMEPLQAARDAAPFTDSEIVASVWKFNLPLGLLWPFDEAGWLHNAEFDKPCLMRRVQHATLAPVPVRWRPHVMGRRAVGAPSLADVARIAGVETGASVEEVGCALMFSENAPPDGIIVLDDGTALVLAPLALLRVDTKHYLLGKRKLVARADRDEARKAARLDQQTRDERVAGDQRDDDQHATERLDVDHRQRQPAHKTHNKRPDHENAVEDRRRLVFLRRHGERAKHLCCKKKK